ncbi:MAG: AmmeMemoRadiSam system protein B [Candidatus Aminicenantes bacterium]|nr:AmmeMemoRadiSam system protein B [Candidatus Aminicenantes bacterium]
MPDEKNEGEETRIPRLRTDLEYIPVSHQGQRGLLVRDPLRLAPSPVLVQGEALSLLGLLDGRRSLKDIRVSLVRQRDGLFVSAEEVARSVSELEAAGILESPRIEALRNTLIEEYTALEVRPAFHAGQAYPADRKDLEVYLDGILESADKALPDFSSVPVRALVAPHIDLEAGRRAYASAYGALRNLPPPRRVLLLGTGHGLASGFFSLTAKDFESPLGRVRTDRDGVRRLREAAGPAAAPHDFGHRSEHSLEFQLIFLQRLFGSQFDLIPVLCGSFQEELPLRRRAAEIPGVRGAVEHLAELVAETGPETLVVAGVDLSHVGPKFGHDLSASALTAETKRHDRKLIEALCRTEAEAFWQEVRSTGDRFNVCGFSALACLLEILPASGLKGRVLDYDLHPEEATRSAVSFVSLVFQTAEPPAATKEKES